MRCGPASLGLSGMMPCRPAGPCPLQSRRDNKTNNFLDLLSWTPFIFPQPRGRADLMVGPKCGSCAVTGGWARPGWAGPGQAGLLSPGQLPPLPSPCPITLYCPHSPPSLFPLRPFSVLLLLLLSGPLSESLSPPSWFSSLPPLVSVTSRFPLIPPPLSLPLPPSLGPWLSHPSSPPLPGPLLASSLGPLSLLPPFHGCLAVPGRPRWWFSLGSAVQLLPRKGQLAGRGRREVPSWGVPGALAGPSRLQEYRGVRLWSEPSVRILRQEARAWEGEEPGNGQPLTPEVTCPLIFSA